MALATVKEMPKGFVDPASKQFKETTQQNRFGHNINTTMATYAWQVNTIYMMPKKGHTDSGKKFLTRRKNSQWKGGNNGTR